jgi:hypothetical protein
MPAFHLLRCMVALGGDHGNTVYRHRHCPIVFPELPVLQFLHGDDAITDVAVVGTWETTNEAVLHHISQIYDERVIKDVFPGVRPRLPASDPSIPFCTRPVYKPKPTLPDSPDPILTPLGQFTGTSHMPVLEAPDLPPENEPTPDEIAAHAQDDEDEDLGLGPVPVVVPPPMPRPQDQPRVVRDTSGRGSSRTAAASRAAANLPDVNAGASHAPRHVQQHRSRA